MTIGPRQANLVLIAYASSEGSGETARIRAVSPEPPLLAHTSSESRGTFKQKARSLAPLNGWACAVKICHDGMLEDTNSLDAVQVIYSFASGTCSPMIIIRLMEYSLQQSVLRIFESRHDKSIEMIVRPAKTQISLGIRPSDQSSLSA